MSSKDQQAKEANFAGLCKELYPKLEVADSVFIEALRKHGDEGLAMEEVANWQPWESKAVMDPEPAPKKPNNEADLDSIERQKREFEKFEKANKERLEREKKEKEEKEKADQAKKAEQNKREEKQRLQAEKKKAEKARREEKQRLAKEEKIRKEREEQARLAKLEREKAKAEEEMKARIRKEIEQEEKEKREKEAKENREREQEAAKLQKEKEEKAKREKEEKERKEMLQREKEAKEQREKEEKEQREKELREKEEERIKQEVRERFEKEKREKEEKERIEREVREKIDAEEKEKLEQEKKEKEEGKGKEKSEDQDIGDIIKELADLKGMKVDFVGANAPPRISIYVGQESDLSPADHQKIKDAFMKKGITEQEIRILAVATDREIQQFLKTSLKKDTLDFPIVCVDGQPVGSPNDVYGMDDAQIEKLLSSTPEDPLFCTGEGGADNSEVTLGAMNQVLSAGEYLASGVGSLLMLPVTALTWPFRSAPVDPNAIKGKNDVEFDVIHTNWYWRSQWRVFRFSDTYVSRHHPRHRDMRGAHQYDTIPRLHLTDPKNIVFYYSDNSSPDYLHAKEEDVREMVRIVKSKNPDVQITKDEK
mmetsp:Transcript_40272/g.63728  ORF Transcript_40272/g.63728 Transcript_40272/m.63728 type:complete len:596 (-) Transcript_40272:94-1881(-)|eukprot:CAMPEP_0201518530 /NCGR_PEP_ID=MMETSP0161_2-20130828/9346_1 /ASSEMBLY_ACC=CAM_ASM_000251 /TAXON_ID=180227 /ORGANISM="Neoparamoeba aestuarina, Strain SoJaBio B1-5/56/2" /LENGTH=595 /DNA_ID=CAMNT_0047916329 /DNA_START=84 /DNA_END=1871 /DNA_ORIENTATION=-